MATPLICLKISPENVKQLSVKTSSAKRSSVSVEGSLTVRWSKKYLSAKSPSLFGITVYREVMSMVKRNLLLPGKLNNTISHRRQTYHINLVDQTHIYLKRSEGGRGMIGVEDCVTIETNSLMSYIKQHANEKALKAVAREQVLKVMMEGMDKKSLREERREKYLAKPLHGQFFRCTEKRDERSLEWLKRGKRKRQRDCYLQPSIKHSVQTV